MEKNELYKTAFWKGNGEYVALVKYHKSGDWFEIRTISGETFNAQARELTEFVL